MRTTIYTKHKDGMYVIYLEEKKVIRNASVLLLYTAL